MNSNLALKQLLFLHDLFSLIFITLLYSMILFCSKEIRNYFHARFNMKVYT